MSELGYNYRMTDIQASLGISQLKKLNSFIRTRRKIAKEYKKQLDGVSEIILPSEVMKARSARHLFVIRTKNKKERFQLREYLSKNNINTQIHYPAVYTHPYYRNHGYKKVYCENAEFYANTCISIPLYPDLSKKEVAYISSTIKRFYA